MRLFEAKTLADSVKLSTLASETILNCLQFVTQVHVWHWQTKQYAAHKALGDYYEGLQDSVDELAEVFFGHGGKLAKAKQSELSIEFDKDNAVSILKEFRNSLNETQSTFMESENSEFNGVGDIILDIVKSTDKLVYLLSLE